MLLALLLACSSKNDTTATRHQISSQEPATLPCSATPSWQKLYSRAVSTDDGDEQVTISATAEGACTVMFEARDAGGKALVSFRLPGAPAGTRSGSTSASSPGGALELWVAAVGAAGTSATYTYAMETLQER